MKNVFYRLLALVVMLQVSGCSTVDPLDAWSQMISTSLSVNLIESKPVESSPVVSDIGEKLSPTEYLSIINRFNVLFEDTLLENVKMKIYFVTPQEKALYQSKNERGSFDQGLYEAMLKNSSNELSMRIEINDPQEILTQRYEKYKSESVIDTKQNAESLRDFLNYQFEQNIQLIQQDSVFYHLTLYMLKKNLYQKGKHEIVVSWDVDQNSPPVENGPLKLKLDFGLTQREVILSKNLIGFNVPLKF